MNAIKRIIAIAVLMLLSACATRPGSIHASYVSHERFINLSCEELASQMAETSSELNHVAAIQDHKATNDAWSVFLVGVPVSKLTGDHEGEIARLKGEIEAVETAQIKNGCK